MVSFSCGLQYCCQEVMVLELKTFVFFRCVRRCYACEDPVQQERYSTDSVFQHATSTDRYCVVISVWLEKLSTASLQMIFVFVVSRNISQNENKCSDKLDPLSI